VGRTPFAHLLLYLQRQASHGTLVLWGPQRAEDERPAQDRIFFEQGMPLEARLAAPASRLDRGLLPLFARSEGTYAFYDSLNLVGGGDGVVRGQVALLALIAASLRGSSRDDVVAQVCNAFGDARLRLEAGAPIDELGLLPDERAVVDILRAEPLSVARLVELSPVSPTMASRIVYLLAITKCVARWEGVDPRAKTSRPPSSSVSDRPLARIPHRPPSSLSVFPPPKSAAPDGPRLPRRPKTEHPVAAPPPELEAEDQALWNEVNERTRTLDAENYFEMLGVSRDAGGDEIQAAYFELVKKWHPDRMPRALSPLRPKIELIFRELTRAHETLMSPDKRSEYLETVKQGGGTPAADRKLARIVQAALDFRMFEIHLKRRDIDEALRIVETCLAANDEEPDYLAAYAWVLLQKGGADLDLPNLLSLLDRALERSPEHDRALYYKGMVLDRMGRARPALECFRKAASINPRNLDAQRMVRLSEMRANVADDKPPAGGNAKAPASGKSVSGKSVSGPAPKSEPGKGSKASIAGETKESLFGKLFGRKS
jgi:tetratricopeptide (TPR) repeat protein